MENRARQSRFNDLGEANELIGLFAAAAQSYVAAGVVPIPCGGVDGKKPLVKWRHYKRPPGPKALDTWRARFANANVGIVTGPSRLTVVDCDDPAMVSTMLAECGDTPLIADTPRGGTHLYYRHTGEVSRNSLVPGVDVKAAGGFVVVPPSIRPDTGKPYRFKRGSLADLDRLPPPRAGSLPLASQPRHTANDQGCIPKGRRNNALFRMALRDASSCDDFDALLDCVRGDNECCEPPLADAEVVKVTQSVWRYQTEGRNWVGSEARAQITASELDELTPDAVFLLMKFRVAHACREGNFAVANSMAGSLDWTLPRFRKANQELREKRYMKLTHVGGKGPGDPPRAHLLR